MDARLSEIDRKLVEIQAELGAPADQVSSTGGATTPPPPTFSTGGRSGPLEDVLLRAPRPVRGVEDGLARRIAELAELQADLLGSLREVLASVERVLGPPSNELTVTAGPFRTLSELRSFEQALSALPGVRTASVRGYEGADRAVIDVQLGR